MKTLRNLFLAAVVALTPLLTFGAANDIKISQSNSGGTAWIDRIFQPTGGTAITSVATFRTGLGLGTADSVTFGTVTTTTAFRAADGSIAVPSISFTNDTNTGFYSYGADTIGISLGGAVKYALGGSILYVFDSNFTINNAAVNNSIGVPSSGAITLTATNSQNITLTPGSGAGIAISNSDTQIKRNATGRVAIVGTSTTSGLDIFESSTNTASLLTVSGQIQLTTQSNQAITFRINAVEKARFASTTGNLLLGALTTDGTGALQFATHTTAAGGLTLGSGVNIFTPAVGRLTTNLSAGSAVAPAYYFIPSATTSDLEVYFDNSFTYIGPYSNTGLKLITNAGTTAFTISSAGLITKALDNFINRSGTSLANGSGASTGTLTNAPAIGNPTKWVGIDDNGTTRYLPAW